MGFEKNCSGQISHGWSAKVVQNMPEYSCTSLRMLQEGIPLKKFILSIKNTKIGIIMLLKLMHNKFK